MKKVLLIKLRSLGDSVLLLGAVEALKFSKLPVQVEVLVSKPFGAFFKSHPFVYRVWEVESTRKFHLLKVFFHLWNMRWDWVFHFHASSFSSMLCFFLGKHRAIHFHDPLRKTPFYSVPIPDQGKVKSILERDLDTLRAWSGKEEVQQSLGNEARNGVLKVSMPKIYIPSFLKEEAKSWWEQSTQDFKSVRRPYLVMHIGASRETKKWPIRYFLKSAILWHQKTGGSIGIWSGPWEEEESQQFYQLLLEYHVFAKLFPKKELLFLSALLKQADLFLGNDSGPKHIACALNIPTVTLFGPEHPKEWHPYDKSRHVVCYEKSLSCRKKPAPEFLPWCSQSPCPEGHHLCMESLKPNQVMEQVFALLKKEQKK